MPLTGEIDPNTLSFNLIGVKMSEEVSPLRGTDSDILRPFTIY